MPTPTLDPRPVVLVVGDSYAAGSDMNKGPTWPYLMTERNDWILYNESVGGTGYLFTSKGTSLSFLQRRDELYDYAPDVVILAGGANDQHRYPPHRIQQAAEKILSDLQRHLPKYTKYVVFSPFCGPVVTQDARNASAALKRAAEHRRATFLDVTEFVPLEDYGSDNFHPTDTGHRVLAKRIGRALVKDGVVEPSPHLTAGG